ncbi:MFS transporter [Streptomyces sp. NPDC002513]
MTETSAAREGEEKAMPHNPLDQVYRKVNRRLIPFIFACYTVAFLDRVNIGFSKLQMQQDLHLSNAAFGLGAGIFFIGYIALEVPSNLLMTRFGARRTLSTIMVLWSLASAGTALVTSPAEFYVLRFLLGAFEAGFVPGVLLYLTYWYPERRRGAASAWFLAAAAFAGAFGSPISGEIIQELHHALGLSGWQWLLLIEGVPTLILGILLPRVLDDGPQDARWLTAEEKELLKDDNSTVHTEQHHNFRAALREPRLYVFGFVYFALLSGFYLISFWLPTIVGTLGHFSSGEIGLVTAVPFAAGTVATIWLGRHSDRTQERRWHIAVAEAIGIAALVVTTWVHNPVLSIILFTIAASGITAAFPLIWPLPGRFFSGAAIAGALAIINSMGTFSGFVIPYVAGWIQDGTGSINYVIYLIGCVVVLGLVALLVGVPAPPRQDRGTPAAQVKEPSRG